MQSQQGRAGRKKYYCEHPDHRAGKIKDSRGMPIYNFIGFGNMTPYSQLTLKTSKRWCPLNK
ncbi:hypothetical protein MF625_000975 [Paenibacillus polymyxa]|uniref:hypothetical protein n=1 Tax=Paenibacillus polymyxa TaxID=1406 RepID=UPI002023F558|nr:hypothetical protein [Paenibacillus polymyxa]URJ36557.1 hypothetical protein MF625_000975 [Paenibacillus polymyxa]